jgi:hypothetical protein
LNFHSSTLSSTRQIEATSGFEDYAKLKGYDVAISVDASVPKKFGFKFTLGASVRTVTKQEVQNDLKDYIARVQSGDDLNDFPQNLPVAEHQTLSYILRSRINFLNYTIREKDNLLKWRDQIIERQDKLLEGFANKQVLLPAMSIHVHQENAPTIRQSVVVGSTPEERQTQIQALENLLAALHKQATESGKPVPSEVIRPLENVKEELAEEKPDPKRVIGWLENAKYGLKALGLVRDVKDAAVAAYIAFNLIFN